MRMNGIILLSCFRTDTNQRWTIFQRLFQPQENSQGDPMERTFEQRFSTVISARHPPGRKGYVKNLLHSVSNTRIDPKTVLQDAIVRLSGYFYAVNLGTDVNPHSHYVGKNR